MTIVDGIQVVMSSNVFVAKLTGGCDTNTILLSTFFDSSVLVPPVGAFSPNDKSSTAALVVSSFAVGPHVVVVTPVPLEHTYK